MKSTITKVLPVLVLILTGFRFGQSDNIEFVCMKKQMAANQCHYNFKVDGGKYRFVDIGCRFKKKDEVIKKVKDGSLALAKDWKIECPEAKEKKEGSGF